MSNVEILAPAGSLDGLYASFQMGADAVYVGTSRFGARAFAKNPSVDELEEALVYAHMHDKKIYLTVNTLLSDRELENDLFPLIAPLYEAGLDACIVQDLGVLSFLHENFPQMDLHASTQMTILSGDEAELYRNYGVTRFVPARECTIEEIRAMRAQTDLEIEVFVHGALCYCYSGQCLMSEEIGDRSGNRGMCAQPCRLPFTSAYGNGHLFSTKDMCTLMHIPELVDAGIDSFKIEGRMKTALYVATVARTYRKAIDDYLEDPQKYRDNMPWYLDQISNCTYRQFTTGFYFGKPTEESQIYDSNTYVKEYTYLGIVGEICDGRCKIEQRNKFSVGETIEIMKPDGENVEVTVKRIINEEGEDQESAPHSKQVLYIELEGGQASPYDILRRQEPEVQ